MSMDEITAEQDASGRGRAPRVEVEAGRRRRRTGMLDVMAHDRLNPFDDGMLDHTAYVYRWQTDEGGALRALTTKDDYDFVNADDLDGFDITQTDSESDGRIRLIMNGAQAGPNAIYGYLLRKPRDFWEEDRGQVSDFYEQMMEGRVYEAQSTNDDDVSVERARQAGHRVGPQDRSAAYALESNQLGSVSGTRRRGPVTRSLK
jgi:hypothetical protein